MTHTNRRFSEEQFNKDTNHVPQIDIMSGRPLFVRDVEAAAAANQSVFNETYVKPISSRP